SNLENHILGSTPAGEFTGKLHSNKFGHFQLPWQTSHYIHRIRTTNTNSNHAQSTCIWSMRVCPHHHTSREGIILEYHLVDDTRTRFPKSNSIFVGYISQEFIHLTVGDVRRLQVGFCIFIRLYQVITMHCGRYSRSST